MICTIKQWGLYQNKVNSSLAAIQRPGHLKQTTVKWSIVSKCHWFTCWGFDNLLESLMKMLLPRKEAKNSKFTAAETVNTTCNFIIKYSFFSENCMVDFTCTVTCIKDNQKLCKNRITHKQLEQNLFCKKVSKSNSMILHTTVVKMIFCVAILVHSGKWSI